MHLPSLSFYRVAYESRPPVLWGASQRALSAEEITESCELLLATAQQHECHYWILDGRHHRSEQPQPLHDWMQDEYFPRVRAVLGQTPCVAFLVPPAIWAGLPAKGYQEPSDWHAHAVHMGWFTEEAPARDWLNQQRIRQGQTRSTMEARKGFKFSQ